MESEKKLVPRNDAKAFELFVAASKTPGLNAKFGRALTNLGEMFEYGRAPQSRRDAESEDAKSKWKEGCENKALELCGPSSTAPHLALASPSPSHSRSR